MIEFELIDDSQIIEVELTDDSETIEVGLIKEIDSYNELKNKPSINNVTLEGNKTLHELGIQPEGDYATNTYINTELNKKVDKVSGKGLSTNDYTTPEKNKLASLENYDDTEIRQLIDTKQPRGNYLTEETDPTVPNHVKTITQNNITNWNNKQEQLISGTNIKTINNTSILGSGNIEIESGGSDYSDLTNKPKINNVELNGNKTSSDLGLQPAGNYQEQLTAGSGINIKSIQHPVLPIGYTQVEYLENEPEKTATIDLGVGSSILVNVEMDCQMESTLTAGNSVLIYKTTSAGGYFGSKGTTCYWGTGGSEDDANTDIICTERVTANLTFSANGRVISGTINEQNFTRTGGSGSSSNSITLGHSTLLPGFKIWSLIVKNENNEILFNGVPCKNEQNIYGLYDIISNTFKSSETEDQFTGSSKEIISGKLIELEEEDLSNYVQKTDYATSGTAGIIRVGTAVSTYMSSDNRLSASTRTYEDYTSGSAAMFVGKGTLENVITGKGLVSNDDLENYVTNTDYGSFATGGVIKASSTYGTQFASTGAMYAQTKTYEQYTNSTSPGLFIGKGTLENVIEGKGLVTSTDLASKQNITDNTLTTTNKTIPTAINEVNSIAKGSNQAVGYNNYSAMITAINAMDDETFLIGQNLYIVTVNVPDLWVSSVESTSSTYTYVDDATVINDLETNGYIQVGYYKLSMLETQKVDLTNYVKNTDYASTSKVGVVKAGSSAGTDVVTSNGLLYATKLDFSTYSSASDNAFIGKGTLENVITGKELVSNTDYANSATGGVIKVSSTTGTGISGAGVLYASNSNYNTYNSASDYYFIGKGTLENVIEGKGLVTKSDIPKVFYGTSATGASTATKVVVCEEFTEADLVAGTRLVVQFTNGNSYNGQATLNVNSTGAKNIYYNGTTTNARYMWVSGESVEFIYNGEQWATINGGLASTTYYGVTKLVTSAGSDSQVYALTPRALYYFANYSIAPYYSASETYAVGDKVRYSYYIYECITAIETPEAWTAAHWQQIDTLQEQIDTKVSNTDYATPSVGGVIMVKNGDHGITVDEGVLKGTVRTLAQYNDMSSKGIVCKGTLENVITGKALDLKQLSTFDNTKTQVLKNINGTLTWVDE